MKTHLSGVPRTRALAATAFLIAMGPALAAADAPERISGDQKNGVFLEILSERVASGEISRSGTPPRPDIAGTESCFTGGLPGLDSGLEARIRDATLLLLSSYRVPDGGVFVMNGTGTVIRADQGENRVLTASHVASPRIDTGSGVADLISVHAFDGEGRLVATLKPHYAMTEPFDLSGGAGDLIHEEVTVLEPARFPNPAMAMSWADRGLDLAPTQSQTLIFGYGEAGLTTTLEGYSGAALLNPDGQVIGVLAENKGYATSAFFEAPNTPMPEAIFRHADPGYGAEILPALSEMAGRTGSGYYRDGVIAGAPISDPGALRALGADPGRIPLTWTYEGSEMISAGFPWLECRISGLTHTPRPEATYQPTPGLHQGPAPITYGGLMGLLSDLDGVRISDPFGQEPEGPSI